LAEPGLVKIAQVDDVILSRCRPAERSVRSANASVALSATSAAGLIAKSREIARR
jgi:hypothetical protein